LQTSLDRKNPENSDTALVDRVNHGLSLITVKGLSTSEIQKLVPAGSSVIEYYASSRKLYAWILENNSLKFHDLQVNIADIKGQIKEYEMMIRHNPDAESLRRIRETSYRIYEQIFKPLENSLGHRHIYIVPHQTLHFLPFESLYDGQQFLVTRYAVAYLPSASVLQWLRPAKKQLDRVLVLGNPEIDYRDDLPALNGAQEESRLIAAHFPIQRVYLEQQATETVLRREQGSYDVLHIASHAIFDAEHPLASTIYLTRDQEHDGMLTAGELYGIQASASVVTLSACETGLSAVRNGDELIGLLRGFFFMGSSSVTASLWKVSDEATKELMVLFYKHAHEGHNTLVQALQSAKREMLTRPSYEHPFFWAAFNLYGLGL
jgi:CHAT domain-containing protein